MGLGPGVKTDVVIHIRQHGVEFGLELGLILELGVNPVGGLFQNLPQQSRVAAEGDGGADALEHFGEEVGDVLALGGGGAGFLFAGDGFGAGGFGDLARAGLLALGGHGALAGGLFADEQKAGNRQARDQRENHGGAGGDGEFVPADEAPGEIAQSRRTRGDDAVG